MTARTQFLFQVEHAGTHQHIGYIVAETKRQAISRGIEQVYIEIGPTAAERHLKTWKLTAYKLREARPEERIEEHS